MKGKKPAKAAEVPAFKRETVGVGPEAAEAAAAAVTKRRASHGAAARRSRKRARGGGRGGDLISNLADDILRTIISLLPTKDGARTQAIARRWRPLWRTAPLNLQAYYSLCSDEFKLPSVVSKILSDHKGPARRFAYTYIPFYDAKRRLAYLAWFHSLSLANLQELDISFQVCDPGHERVSLPPSVLLCASTLVMARISWCDFPKEITSLLSFPLLKQLNLWFVSISEDVFHGLLSGCHVLESLNLERIQDVGCFRISSPTLRSVHLCACFSSKEELVIEDAPRLERLLLSFTDSVRETIRVIRAPKLEIVGPLSSCISEIEITNQVSENLTATSLRTTIDTVKVLALGFSIPNLNAVIDVLRCFPCLEKLYVNNWENYFGTPMQNRREYDPLDPVKCLETHLKKIVLKKYYGDEQDVDFAKFFVLNTKVLKEIKFRVGKKISKKWVADQYRLLEVGNRASRDAQLKFIHSDSKFFDAHDLSIGDPFTCYIFNEVDAFSEESY